VGLQAKTLLLMVVGVFQNLSNIVISSSFDPYQINFASVNSKKFENSYFIIDDKLQDYLDISADRCIFIAAKEANKTLSSVEDIMIQLSEKGMTKNNKLVVVGGGYLQDIGTLVASLYMRGVKWIYIPTTLAAMGDSCIGGKSSINAGEVKNLVGNFYPPREVLIDSSFVSTLPNIEIIAGISEIIKICFARSFDTFVECSRLISEWQLNRNQQTIIEIIQLSIGSKQYFVEEDEFDSGVRKLLNFGHSFGHALESASDYKIPHGVAVLAGMVAASQHPLSASNTETKLLIESCLTLSRSLGKEITNELSKLEYVKFSQALSKDKKNTNSELVLILPMAMGLELVKIPFSEGALASATDAMTLGIELVLNEIR
jgi:3-dehydroquinate synthase